MLTLLSCRQALLVLPLLLLLSAGPCAPQLLGIRGDGKLPHSWPAGWVTGWARGCPRPSQLGVGLAEPVKMGRVGQPVGTPGLGREAGMGCGGVCRLRPLLLTCPSSGEVVPPAAPGL